MDIEKFTKNPKTAYLAENYKTLLRQKEETLEMIKNDPTLRDLAQGELESLRFQMKTLSDQMEGILAEEEKESLDGLGTNEVILEVRAGAGGEEASLFAQELAEMY